MTDDPAGEFYAALLEDDPEQLYDQAPIGYLTTTADGLVVKVNHTFAAMVGRPRDDVVGRLRLVDLLTAGGRIYHETHYLPLLLMQGQVREIALDLVRGDGERISVLVNSVLDRDPAGAPTVIRTAVFDATERRGYERELVGARRRAEESEARAVALAQTLQQTLIPPAAPAIAGLDVAGRYRPAGDGQEVGGDFYDIFQIGPGDWVVAIGDVCGKGVEAAVVTSLARYTLRGSCVPNPLPSNALRVLNSALLAHDTDRYCTVALARFRREDAGWRVTISCGGHPLPLLLRAGQATPVGQHGTLIGILADPLLSDTEIVLAPGESLVFYTDGVTEGRREREYFGTSRLVASVQSHAPTATALADGVLADALEFQRGVPRDDLAVVAAAVPATEHR